MLVLTALAGAWIAFELIWFVTGRPAEQVDYVATTTAMVGDRQPPGVNGWPTLFEAADRFDEVVAEFKGRLEADREPHGFSALDFNGMLVGAEIDETHYRIELDALDVMRDRGVFERLAAAAAAPRFVRALELDPDQPLLASTLPGLSRSRSMARMRVASMRLAAIRGDRVEHLAAFEQSLAIGRAIGSQCFLIDRLVAQAIFMMVLAETRHELLEHDFDEATCRAMLEILDRQASLPPIAHAIEGERMAMLDLVQRSFTDNRHGDGQIKPAEMQMVALWGTGGAGADLSAAAMAPLQAGRRETLEVMDRFFDALQAETRMTPLQRQNAAPRSAAIAGALGYRHVFVSALLPALNQAGTLHDEMEFQIRVMRVMIALEAYRARHGRYPARLEDLVPDSFAEAPVDPVHGGSFVYRPTPDGAAGLPYLLYSTGLDQVDDSREVGPAEAVGSTTFDDLVWGPAVDVMIIRRRRPRSVGY
jgi:hypothetical protein